jgi:hypothetical protein
VAPIWLTQLAWVAVIILAVTNIVHYLLRREGDRVLTKLRPALDRLESAGFVLVERTAMPPPAPVTPSSFAPGSVPPADPPAGQGTG